MWWTNSSTLKRYLKDMEDNKDKHCGDVCTDEKIDIGDISKGNFVRTYIDDEPCVVTGILHGENVETTRDDGTRLECHVDLLAPIPLTDGILEKTGFHHCMPYNDWTNDTVDLILYDAADGYAVQNTSITIRYVHQFQNLLKQCKTKIEVKL